jgi:hypothetical protein
VAKKSRRNRGYRAPGPAQASGSARSLRLWVAVAVVVVVAIVGAGAIAFWAANATANASDLPAGTQVFAENDHTHVTGTVQYDRDPPAGGPHSPIQLNCGVYTDPVPNENAVHSLEHGAVWITYQPTLSADQVAELQSIAVTNFVGTERYIILSPYAGIPAPIVASAWGAQLYLDSASDPRLVQFIHRFAGGSQGGEPGGPCTGGVGTPTE